MNLSKSLETVARAEDTNNLLEHIAWTDTILPELVKLKKAYEAQLVEAVLGNRPKDTFGQPLTTEQLAGRAYGLGFIMNLMTGILTRGDKALREIQAQGINPQ